jgi:NAD(P)H-dependent FMN reductase
VAVGPYTAVVIIATWCGSLGPGSANASAIDVATRHLRQGGVEVETIVGLELIPAFRADRVDDAAASVVELRSMIERVDGVLLAAPEYAGGVAGVVKNALDWLVGSGSLYHKPIAVLSVGTTGGEFAIDQLVRTLSWQGALTVATLGIASPRTKVDESGAFTDPPTILAIQNCADALASAVRGTAEDRRAMVTAVVTRHGIDPARFGDLP